MSTPNAWFYAGTGASIVWTLAALWAMGRGRWNVRLAYGSLVLDTGILAAIVYGTGGGHSMLPEVVLLLAAVSGLIRRPGRAALTGLLVVIIDVAAALPDLVHGRPVLDELVGGIATAGFATLVGVAFASGLTRLADHAEEIDQARRRLLTSSLDAEDAERRRVSRELGGEALQILLAASQDLEESEGNRDLLTTAREEVRSGVAILRQTVRDLHPTALRHAGLEAALRVAIEHRVQGEVDVHVAGDAIGVREAMLLALVRELGEGLRDTERDDHVRASVTREAHAIRLEVTSSTLDPIAHGASAVAWAGRVARLRERVEADGGALEYRDDGLISTLAASLSVDGHTPRELDAAPPEPEEIALSSARTLALVRVLALPLGVLLLELHGHFSFTLLWLGMGMALWQVIGAGISWEGPGGRSSWFALIDVTLLGALVLASGGIDSPLRGLVLVVPFLLVFRAPPRTALGLACVLVLVSTIASLPDVIRGESGAVSHLWPWLVALAWSTAAARRLGTARQELRDQLATLERARRRVLHDSLAMADAERRRLSEALHDNALQVLMIAGQDLDEALDGDRAAWVLARQELDEGIRLVREAMAELHPPALEHGGLRPAVVALLEAARVRGGFTVVVAVSPEAAGVRDELVLALVRELVGNAAKHAQASEVRVRVARQGDRLLLEVADDGVGIAPGRPMQAIAQGHIGLASARERVEIDGGSLELDTAPGEGTRVRIRLVAEPVSTLV